MNNKFIFVLLFSTSASFGDGSEQACGGSPKDIVFILDESGSIYGPDFKKQLDFIQSIIESLDVGLNRTHIGVMTFGTTERVIFQLNNYTDKNETKAAVANIKQIRGQTYTHLALRRLHQEMFSSNYSRPGVSRVAMVITDGESDFPKLTKEEAELCKNAGYVMLAVGVGAAVVQAELEAIASTADDVFKADNYSSLETLKKKLVSQACKPCENKPIDVAFLLDESTSIWGYDFKRVLDFVQSIIDYFDVGPNRTHVAVIAFATKSRVIFRLNKYPDKNRTKNAVANIKQKRGQTYTHLALKQLRTHVLSSKYSRSWVSRVAIVITDGDSDYAKKTKAEANLCKKKGYRMLAVGVGTQQVQTELETIASTADDVYKVDNYSSLMAIKDKLASKACERESVQLNLRLQK